MPKHTGSSTQNPGRDTHSAVGMNRVLRGQPIQHDFVAAIGTIDLGDSLRICWAMPTEKTGCSKHSGGSRGQWRVPTVAPNFLRTPVIAIILHAHS